MKRLMLAMLLLAGCAFGEQPWPKRTADAKFTEMTDPASCTSLNFGIRG